MDICELYKDGCLLRVKLTPNASVCGFKGCVEGMESLQYLKAFVRAVPEKGKANAELLKLLSKTLKIAKGNMSIISGAAEHYKKIYIESSMPADKLCALINGLAENKEQ